MGEKALELIDVGAGCCDACYGLGTIGDGLYELSAGVTVGLVIVLCWNTMVWLSHSLFVYLMWHLWVR